MHVLFRRALTNHEGVLFVFRTQKDTKLSNALQKQTSSNITLGIVSLSRPTSLKLTNASCVFKKLDIGCRVTCALEGTKVVPLSYLRRCTRDWQTQWGDAG